MSHINHNDETLFDRLVDGELSATERQQLLASLDDRQDGWRDCALAFLEAQTWGHQFKQLLADKRDQPPAVTTRTQSTTSTKLGQWLAVAASLLLAFTVGWLTKTPSNLNPQPEKVVTIDREELPLRDEPTDSEDAITLLVRDTDGNNRRLQVPLMDVESLDGQFDAALPEKLKASFRDRGYDLQRRRRFAPMFFEQDEQLVPMVVPVDDTYIVPVSRPVY